MTTLRIRPHLAAWLITPAVLLSACAELGPVTRPETGLQETWRTDTASVRERPGFDPAAWQGVRAGPVRIALAEDMDPDDRAALEKIRAELQTALAKTPAGQTSPGRDILTLETTITDVRLIDPALNVVTAVAVFVPLDTGAMTVTAAYRDPSGQLQAARTDRVIGSPLDIRNALSTHGRLETAARDWADACGVWPGCLSKQD